MVHKIKTHCLQHVLKRERQKKSIKLYNYKPEIDLIEKCNLYLDIMSDYWAELNHVSSGLLPISIILMRIIANLKPFHMCRPPIIDT